MKPDLTKEDAYEIVNCYIQDNQLRKNQINDIDKCVAFHDSFEKIDGAAWTVRTQATITYNEEFSSYESYSNTHKATYVVSDKARQVERIINKEVYRFNHDFDHSIELNLTKEEAYQIVSDYNKKHGYEYDESEDIDDHILFCDFDHDFDGAAWLITFEGSYMWGAPADHVFVVSDKTKQLVDVQDDHGRSIMPDDKEEIPLIERLKKAFESGTEDEQADAVEDIGWRFLSNHDDEENDQNIDDFDEIMEMLINYVIENKDSEIVEDVLEIINDAHEFQDTKHVDFSLFAQNLHTVTGESLLQYIDILANTKDPTYTPYVLSLKNHENNEVRFKVANALQKSLFNSYSKI